MDVKFNCPLCGTANFLSSVLGENQSYTHKCRGCAKTVIWAGSESLAKSKRAGASAGSVKFERGTPATLADAEPGVSIGSKEDVAKLLTDGSAGTTVADSYSQGERIEKYSKDDASVKEGVCNGQSLHWIRRVLQGGRTEYKPPESKLGVARSESVLEAKRRGQHMGGAASQKATTPAQLDKFTDAAYKAYSDSWDQLSKKRADAQKVYDKKMADLGAKKTPTGGWSYSINDKTKAAVEEWDTVCAFVKGEKEKLDAAKDIREKSGTYKNHWEEIAKSLDTKLAEAAVAKKKRPFSGIVCLKSLNRETCAGSTTAFADKLANDPGFKVGTCALISIGLQIGIGEGGGAISGHAVAVHYVKSNLLSLFDPNIGVFTCTSKGVMKAALIAMIDRGWVKVFGWQLDDQFGYSLFETRASTAEVTPKQQQVHYTVSAQTTAIQNKNVIPSSTEAPKVAPSKPVPTLIVKPVVPTTPSGATGGGAKVGGNAALRMKLIAAMGDAKNHLAKRAGVATADGLGYVKLSGELSKELAAAKFTHADLKPDNPMGSVLMKGTVNQLIEQLK